MYLNLCFSDNVSCSWCLLSFWPPHLVFTNRNDISACRAKTCGDSTPGVNWQSCPLMIGSAEIWSRYWQVFNFTDKWLCLYNISLTVYHLFLCKMREMLINVFISCSAIIFRVLSYNSWLLQSVILEKDCSVPFQIQQISPHGSVAVHSVCALK